MTQGMPLPPEQREIQNAGPLMSGWEVARAATRCLVLRLPPWLDEMSKQMGEPVRIKRPKVVVVRDSVDDATEGQFPAIVVDFRSAAPRRRTEGEYHGTFTVEVIAVTDDTDLGQALKLMGIYAAAIQACLVTTLREYGGGLLSIVDPGPYRVDKRDPTGAVADVLMQIQGGPMLSDSGYLEAPTEEPGPDDQGEQAVITNVDLTYEAHPPGGSPDGNQ